jgi:hypothetical protein
METKPTIGRIVIYKYATNEWRPNGASECPAFIVRVFGDTCVNLKLIEDGPHSATWKTSVMLHSGPDSGDGYGQWTWPERKN